MFNTFTHTLRHVSAAALSIGLATGNVAAQPAMMGAEYPPAEAGNVVGGAIATITGGGDEMVITYSTGGAGVGGMRQQTGRTARFAGTAGDGPAVEYPTPAPASVGREAWVAGGGSLNEVVYVRPR